MITTYFMTWNRLYLLTVKDLNFSATDLQYLLSDLVYEVPFIVFVEMKSNFAKPLGVLRFTPNVTEDRIDWAVLHRESELPSDVTIDKITFFCPNRVRAMSLHTKVEDLSLLTPHMISFTKTLRRYQQYKSKYEFQERLNRYCILNDFRMSRRLGDEYAIELKDKQMQFRIELASRFPLGLEGEYDFHRRSEFAKAILDEIDVATEGNIAKYLLHTLKGDSSIPMIVDVFTKS